VIAGESDLPARVVERRCQPNRRLLWRGGRRDRDWIDRPIGSLGVRHRLALLLRRLLKLPQT
jgi:hypothetical protein